MREKLPVDRRSITHHFSLTDANDVTTDGYVIVGLYEDGRPGEIFIRIAKQPWELGAPLDMWAIAFSIALQHGAGLTSLLSKFVGVQFEPLGYTSNKAIPRAKSVVDYIARWLQLKFCAPPDPPPDASGDAAGAEIVHGAPTWTSEVKASGEGE
jgi:ribonucleoside-diphosphate reductase alpha chain